MNEQISYWCLRLDSNQHILRIPPPQDGVSTNFTTQTYCLFSDLAGIRTQDPYIKSVLLYQLSYQVYNMNEQISYWCLRLDSNQHILRIPPPQDGVSTNFTTQTYCLFSDLAGIRTQDPYIKSVLLYQLSYQVSIITVSVIFEWCKDRYFFLLSKFFIKFVENFYHDNYTYGIYGEW